MEEKLKQTVQHGFKGDRILLIIALLLSAISVLMVYSTEGHGVLKHLLLIAISYGGLILFYKIDYKIWGKFAPLGLLFAVILLILTFMSSAVRGLVILGISFQTFYVIGVLVVLFLASTIAKIKLDDRLPTRNETFFLFGVLLAFCVGIAALNMSTAIILFITGIVVCFVGGIRFKYIAGLLGLALIVIGILSGVVIHKMNQGNLSGIGRMDTFVKRMEYYITKDNSEHYGDQMVLSRAAIARSGLKPAGPGKGVIKYRLPENSTDYAFASIVEETGIYLGLPIIFLYLAFFYRAREIAKNSHGTFGALFAFGIGFLLCCQAFVHIGVNCDLLPSTGQTLPFISTGGASLVVSASATGILLNISKQNAEDIKPTKRQTRFIGREED